MFQNTIDSTKEVIRNLAKSEEAVEHASQAYDKINREIDNAKTRLRRKLAPQRGEAIAKALVESMKKSGELEIILMHSIDVATQTSTEFSRDFYKQALYLAAKQKEIYKLPLFGSGWNSKIIPNILFEDVAGDLNDYARGVKAYRASLKTKVGKEGSTRGERATHYWLTKVYSTPREESTVMGRIGISGKIAPFWRLLNNGTVKMSSDRPDGSYQPIEQRPTDFIGDAEDTIRRAFDVAFNTRQKQEFSEADGLQAEIDVALDVRDELKSILKLLSPDSKINQRALALLGQKFQYVDANKLARAIVRFNAGENVDRILISRPGGRRVYLTARQVEGLLE